MNYYSLLFLLLILCSSCKKVELQERERDFNFNWKFTLIDDTLTTFSTPLKDDNWQDLRLPHDWSIEASFDSLLDGATGYLPGGVAWYQKHFSTSIDSSYQKAFILFDGVYNNAKFWLNGTYLGEHPNGYTPFYFELAEYLNYNGEENVLSVYVDRSRYVDSRWYPGSGIYRNVKLISTNKLHIPIWGTYIHTPEITSEEAIVEIETTVQNDWSTDESYRLETSIIDDSGALVISQDTTAVITSEHTQKIIQNVKISNPKLWNITTPTLYTVVSKLYKNGPLVDTYETPFGIRSIEHNKQQGLLLNGVPIIAKGVCLHHDGGLVGAAVPKGVWRRRLQLLKDAGVNAIRTSHNPFSTEFLELCDEMGFLVQAELFDEFDYPKDKRLNYHDRHEDYISRGYTEHFQDWGKQDLQQTIRRDRNHPSIFEWSIGNEIEWTYLHYRYATGFWEDQEDPQNSGSYWWSAPILSAEETKERYNNSIKGDYILTETAEQLNAWVKELDNSRPTTANLVVPQTSLVSGYADAVDLVGFSYRNLDFPWAQKHFPHKQTTINECPGSWEDWTTVLSDPAIYSMYMWTGIAYLGEAHNSWPIKAWHGDMLNLAGFKNQGWNYFKSIWVDQPHLSLGTLELGRSGFERSDEGTMTLAEGSSYRWRDSNMHWNYEEGTPVLVEVNTNLPEIELFLNGQSLEIKRLEPNKDQIIRWIIPFNTGTLEARSTSDPIIKKQLKTASEPTDFVLTLDKSSIQADGYEVVHCTVQLIDAEGVPVRTENELIEFEIEGPAELLGVDNGLIDSSQDYKSNHLVTGRGQALMILRSIKDQPGTISITAKMNKLKKTLKLKAN